MNPFIRLHPHDDVLIARAQLLGGATVEGIVVRGLIPPGHKVATHAIADHFSRQTNPGALADFPNVDGVVALTHGTGCGMDAEGMGMQILQRVLAGYATHANFAAVLVVGLGCEANQINAWLARSSLREGDSFKVFNIQDSGGTIKTVAKGVALINAMLPQVNHVRREPCSAEHITIGLQCGGSDGYSGISANPALGAAVDLLVAHGGSAILSETPEIYGAEHLLTRRAVRREVGEKLIARIKWWEHYTAINSGEMNNNPSPSLKLATNSALWRKQEDDMDINCGEIIDGTCSVPEMGQRVFELVLATASGARSKSETHGYGQNEFVPWQVGAVM